MYVLGPKQMYIYQRPKTFFIDHRQCCRRYEARWLIALLNWLLWLGFVNCSTTNTSEKYERTQQGNLLGSATAKSIFKGIFTCQNQGSEREYFPIARGPFYIEFIFSRTVLPCLAPQYQCWQKIFLGRPICFSFPAIRPFLHNPNLLNIFKKIQGYLKKMLKLIFHWNSCKLCLRSCSDK